MEQENLSLGQKIKKYRVEKKLTHEDIELRSKVSTRTISDLENDKSRPKIETIYRIGLALELDHMQMALLLITGLATYLERSDLTRS